MPQHISRKELKKDELRDTISHGAELLASHEKAAIYVLIAVIIAAVVVGGWRIFSTRETAKASAAFDNAMEIFQAPVIAKGQPSPAGQITFSDEKTKFTRAAQRFADIYSKYGRTKPGHLADYYAALSEEKLGHDNVAREKLEAIAEGSSDYAAMARLELAQLDDRLGQPAEAEKLYQQLIAHPADLAPKGYVMLAFAAHYTQANKPAEAAKLYNQIKTDFPDTPLYDQANQALALLSAGKS